MSKCKVCNTSIVFVRMADSKALMPCNPGSDPNGNIACTRKGLLYVDGYVITADRVLVDGQLQLLAHWKTCTKPAHLRRPRAAATTIRRPADAGRLF